MKSASKVNIAAFVMGVLFYMAIICGTGGCDAKPAPVPTEPTTVAPQPQDRHYVIVCNSNGHIERHEQIERAEWGNTYDLHRFSYTTTEGVQRTYSTGGRFFETYWVPAGVKVKDPLAHWREKVPGDIE